MMLRTACISVLILSAAALPTNTEDPPLQGWTGDPDGRGTLSILISCVLTLWICVYAAMHLNVPAPEEKERMVLLRYFKWVLIGLFAPEVVVAAAWHQYVIQKALRSKLDELWENSKGKPEFKRKNLWTKVHGFHAVMGGYAFGIDSCSKEFLPDADTARCTLTPAGVLLLAECDHLPDLSEKWIIDKSKADGLAKLLVCIQALWMIVQTIGRLSGHLTVTLIEINTIGHILCALGIYILWWYKPREVGQAVILEGDWVASIHAFMIMCSGVQSPANEPDDMVYFPPSSLQGPTYASTEEIPDPVHVRSSRGAPISSSIPHSDGICGHFEILKRHDVSESGEHALQTRQLSCHRLAAEAIHRYYPVLNKFLAPVSGSRPRKENSGCRDSDGVEGFSITHRKLVNVRALNFKPEGTLTAADETDFPDSASSRIVIWFLSIVYGGIHMAAWNDHFPSEAEKLLWRISTSYIMYVGLCVISMNLIVIYSRSTIFYRLQGLNFILTRSLLGMYAYTTKVLDIYASWYTIRKASRYGSRFGTSLIVLFFFSTRVYIVLEAFISLRSMPADSYDTPNWSELIPHL